MAPDPLKSPSSKRPTRAAGPGRPKDLGKRAAILAAARQMFASQGYEGTSMDQIAAAAGVSKLTVYSHFGDKEALFAAVVRAHCETQLPPVLFEPTPGTPLRDRLLTIGRAFYAMVTTPESVAGHRMLCTPQLAGSPLSRLFWEAGPQRVHDDFACLLERRIEAGELAIDDVQRAAGQFFALLKGEPHARRVFGCCEDGPEAAAAIEAHVAASVDLFLRAYAAPPRARARAGKR
ncbi:MAG TPA: TetR/AcrR family transcriptional regulator [Xanthomonadaceae bacterium]|nr:TetR/AcrR family transcriptional regulator [Xanthomonadaceae bacterium]